MLPWRTDFCPQANGLRYGRIWWKTLLVPLSPTQQKPLSLKMGNLIDKTHQFFSVIEGELLEVLAWLILDSACGLLSWPTEPLRIERNKQVLRDLSIHSEIGRVWYSDHIHHAASLSLSALMLLRDFPCLYLGHIFKADLFCNGSLHLLLGPSQQII